MIKNSIDNKFVTPPFYKYLNKRSSRDRLCTRRRSSMWSRVVSAVGRGEVGERKFIKWLCLVYKCCCSSEWSAAESERAGDPHCIIKVVALSQLTAMSAPLQDALRPTHARPLPACLRRAVAGGTRASSGLVILVSLVARIIIV